MNPLRTGLIFGLLAVGACSAGASGNTASAEAALNVADSVSPKTSGETGTAPSGSGGTAPESAQTGRPMSAAQEPDLSVATDALRSNLLKAGATLDGQPVTGLEAHSSCEGAIVAGEQRATFSWAELGNIAATLDDGREMLELPAGSTSTHQLSMRRGDDSNRVIMGIETLETSCQHS